jgi:hypothetical protein
MANNVYNFYDVQQCIKLMTAFLVNKASHMTTKIVFSTLVLVAPSFNGLEQTAIYCASDFMQIRRIAIS